MEFICMDLIGRFNPPTKKGNKYALTWVDMLTGYTGCIPISEKSAECVIQAYMNHIHTPFGPSKAILVVILVVISAS